MTLSLSGTGAVPGRAVGPAHVVSAEGDAITVAAGAVMVVRVFHPYFAPVLRRIAGLVVEQGGLLQHAVILAREFSVPTVVGVGGATAEITSGVVVTVDGATGAVQLEGVDAACRFSAQ
jgi:phosphohistidine swiveling domain-containing protein